MIGTGAPEVLDTTHFEFSTIALRNKLLRRQRKWGMVVTVNADPTPANNTLWIFVEDLVDNNKLNNANWQKFNEWLAGQGFAANDSPALTGNPTAPTQAAGTNNTRIANTAFVQQEITSAVVGLFDDRGNYDASVNTFPAAGGSGAAGAILKGDIWTISVVGVLGGTNVVVGQTVRALVDNPGQTAANWAISVGSSSSSGVPTTSALPVASLLYLYNNFI
jgi:hypothetical protein